MSKIAIAFGVVLILLGFVLYGGAESRTAFTAFIPSGFGLVLLVCGVLALDEKKRMHAMHGAVLIGLIGFVMPLVMVVPQLVRGTVRSELAATGMVAMSALSGIFVALCVQSFIAARKARKEREALDAKAAAVGVAK